MNKGLLLIPLLLVGCTPVIVMDSEDDCAIVTTRKDNVYTETWQCSGEILQDDDMAIISMHGVSQ